MFRFSGFPSNGDEQEIFSMAGSPFWVMLQGILVVVCNTLEFTYIISFFYGSHTDFPARCIQLPACLAGITQKGEPAILIIRVDSVNYFFEKHRKLETQPTRSLLGTTPPHILTYSPSSSVTGSIGRANHRNHRVAGCMNKFNCVWAGWCYGWRTFILRIFCYVFFCFFFWSKKNLHWRFFLKLFHLWPIHRQNVWRKKNRGSPNSFAK